MSQDFTPDTPGTTPQMGPVPGSRYPQAGAAYGSQGSYAPPAPAAAPVPAPTAPPTPPMPAGPRQPDAWPPQPGAGPRQPDAWPPQPPTGSAAAHAPAYGTGAPGAGTPGTEGALRRPGRWRRLLAWLIDFAVVLAVASLLAVFTFHRISAMVTGEGAAEHGAWGIINSHGDIAGTAQGLGLSLWHSAVRDVEQAFAALAVFAFLYQFLTLLTLRRSPGKALTGMRVAPYTAPGAAAQGGLGVRRAAIRAAVSAVTDVVCYAVACCMLVEGDFVVALFAWVVAVGVFWLNAFPAAFGRGRTVADRFAGTVVTNMQFRQAMAAAAGRGRQLVQRTRSTGGDGRGPTAGY